MMRIENIKYGERALDSVSVVRAWWLMAPLPSFSFSGEEIVIGDAEIWAPNKFVPSSDTNRGAEGAAFAQFAA